MQKDAQAAVCDKKGKQGIKKGIAPLFLSPGKPCKGREDKKIFHIFLKKVFTFLKYDSKIVLCKKEKRT